MYGIGSLFHSIKHSISELQNLNFFVRKYRFLQKLNPIALKLQQKYSKIKLNQKKIVTRSILNIFHKINTTIFKNFYCQY